MQAFLNQLPPTEESALFRSLNPKSWWWNAEIDFLAAILHSINAGNWQRAGGKGPKPQPVTRPTEQRRPRNAPTGRDDLENRRKRIRDAQAARREAL